jgi:fructosamine-3-kinase
LFNSIKSSNQWVDRWNNYLSQQSIIDFLKNNKESGPTKTQVDLVNQEAKKYIK